MRNVMVGTGWKMNLTNAQSRAYLRSLRASIAPSASKAIDIFVLPPFTSLHCAGEELAGTGIFYGAQNMHWDETGSWTGEVSAPMIIEAGCRYVELAHSERLQYFGENYAAVRKKVDRAIASSLEPILCVGELLSDRDAGRTDAVLREQLETRLAGQYGASNPGVVIAYEPRWAIGAAQGADPQYAADRHAGMRDLVRSHWGNSAAERVQIIYGGSVTPENGAGFLQHPEIDGLFAGRSAWRPEGFAALIDLGLNAQASRGELT